MPTRITNPGGAVVEVSDDRAEELLAQEGFSLADEDPGESEPDIDTTEEGSVTVRNPGGVIVEVPRDRAEEFLEQDGFERAEPEPESPPAPPAPTPELEEESESGETPAPEEEEPSESDLTDEELEALPDDERIEYALDSDDFNTMRGVLSDLVDESTQGMGKPEVREALEDLQE